MDTLLSLTQSHPRLAQKRDGKVRKPSDSIRGFSGQSIVEFALALPVILLILIGIMEFGRLLLFYSSVTSSSREGARYGSAAGDVGGFTPHYKDCAGIRAAAKKAAILVNPDFEQVELTEPRKALEQAGIHTFIISEKPGEIQAMNHDEKADHFKVDMTFDQARPEDFDFVLLPGGALNADKLRMVHSARDFVTRFNDLDRPIAVICHAPWLLVSSGLVEGRTLTSYYTLQDDIRNAGGIWKDQAVVRDGNWVSSRNPNDIPAFNQAMLQLFAEYEPQSMAVAGAGQGSEVKGKDSGVPGGGKGRVDEVGGSGVYPASAPNAPEDAQAHGEMSWGQGERGEEGYYDSGSSEVHPGPEEDQAKE